MLRLDVRGVRQRGVGVVGGPLVDGHTLARHGRLVHGARPLDDHAVGRDPLVGTDDDGVTDAEVLDGHLGLGAVTADAGRRRGQLRQRLDGPACAAHRVAFERVADGEQEEQERALEPLAERGGAGRGHEHQEVDLEAPGPDGVDRLADGEPPAEKIPADEERERDPLGHVRERLQRPPHRDDDAAQDGEDEFGPLAEDAAVVVPAGAVVVARVVLLGRLDGPRLVGERVSALGVPLGGGHLRRLRRRDPHTEVGERAAEVGLRRRRPVELDADRAGRVGLGLDHARPLAEPLGDGPRAALAGEPGDRPEHVAVPLGDLGAGALGRAAEARERHGVGVVVEAELGGVAALGRDHVGALDAGDGRQLVGEPGDAGVLGVGRVGEQDVEVEAEGIGHGSRVGEGQERRPHGLYRTSQTRA